MSNNPRPPWRRVAAFTPVLVLGGCQDTNLILDIIFASLDLTAAIVAAAS